MGVSFYEIARKTQMLPSSVSPFLGFTAWSSTKEPEQVFHLLETIYAAFDGIAKRRRIYKVETVGGE